MVLGNNISKINYFHPGPGQEVGRRAHAKKIQYLQKEFKDVVTGTGCANETFSSQVKPDSKP